VKVVGICRVLIAIEIMKVDSGRQNQRRTRSKRDYY
jgi:hypothetical protein